MEARNVAFGIWLQLSAMLTKYVVENSVLEPLPLHFAELLELPSVTLEMEPTPSALPVKNAAPTDLRPSVALKTKLVEMDLATALKL